MKLSQYNWWLDEGDYLLIYNGFTGALVKVVDDRKRGMLEKVMSSTLCPDDLHFQDEQTFQTLCEMGALIPGTFDERQYLRILTDNAKHKGTFAVTAVMTTICNFDCRYCYETEKRLDPVSMSKATASSIAEACRQFGSEAAFITLYGGEPLCNLDVCIFLLEEMNSIEGCEFQAQIISNGFLLEEATAKILSKIGVTSAQVTLDGPPERHNRNRPLIGGIETYRTVVRNIVSASKHMRINVRVNVDSETAGSFQYVKNLFSSNSQVHVYPAAIKNYPKHSCAEPDRDILTKCVGADTMSRYCLGVRQPGCTATNMSGIVVLPDGRIAKCWREVASNETQRYEMPYGLDVRSIVMTHAKWDAFNPYNNSSTCYDCKMLPACAGGCPYNHVFGTEPDCLFSESSYEQFIREKYYLHVRSKEQHP